MDQSKPSDVGFGYIADNTQTRHVEIQVGPASPGLKSAMKVPGTPGRKIDNPLSPTFREDQIVEKHEQMTEKEQAKDFVSSHFYVINGEKLTLARKSKPVFASSRCSFAASTSVVPSSSSLSSPPPFTFSCQLRTSLQSRIFQSGPRVQRHGHNMSFSLAPVSLLLSVSWSSGLITVVAIAEQRRQLFTTPSSPSASLSSALLCGPWQLVFFKAPEATVETKISGAGHASTTSVVIFIARKWTTRSSVVSRYVEPSSIPSIIC